MWKTTTRPFSEELAIVCSPAEEELLQAAYDKVVRPLVKAQEEIMEALAVIQEKDQPLKELLVKVMEKMEQGIKEKKTNDNSEKKPRNNSGGLGFQSLTFEQLLGVIVGFVEKTKE